MNTRQDQSPSFGSFIPRPSDSAKTPSVPAAGFSYWVRSRNCAAGRWSVQKESNPIFTVGGDTLPLPKEKGALPEEGPQSLNSSTAVLLRRRD
jgi:hypothetical protein